MPISTVGMASRTYISCQPFRPHIPSSPRIAVEIGAPEATAILGLDGLWGLKGWQLMYVLEAIPTVLIGVAVFFYLTDRPSLATWLRPEERGWLEQRIGGERRQIEAAHGVGILRSFWDPKVMLLA